MIDLYGNASPNLIKVLFMLGETQLPFEVKYLNLMAGENFSSAYLNINPNGKIPAIVDNDSEDGAALTVIESGAILIYLADKTGQFQGRNSRARNEVMQWLMLQMSGVGPMLGQAMHFRENGPAPIENGYARQRYFTEAARLCDVIDQRLSRCEYVGGGEFSIADMAMFPWLRKYPEHCGIDTSAHINLHRWRHAMEERPGFQRILDIVNTMVDRGLAEQGRSDPDAVDRFFRRGRWVRHPQASTARPRFGEIRP